MMLRAGTSQLSRRAGTIATLADFQLVETHFTGAEPMRRIILAATIIGLSAGGALAQTGGNMNAPTPNSAGTGITKPGTTSTGVAVDRPTTGSAVAPRPTGSEAGNNANSISGTNAAGPNSPAAAEGRTSGGGASAGGNGSN
jgi:hypothetical protein